MKAFQRQTMSESWPFPIRFGDDMSIPLPMNGDIIDALFLRIIWPSSSAVNTSVATAMINFVELQYESVVIERIYGENIFMQNDLTVPQGKRPGLQKLVGTDLTTPLPIYYLKLPFSINLPLCALSSQPVLRVVFNDAIKFMTVPYTGFLDLSYEIDYAYLSPSELSYFQHNTLSYVTNSYQVLQFTIKPGETYFKCVTSFVNDVKEFFYVIQNIPATDMYHYNLDIKQYRLCLNGVEVLSPNVANGLYLSVIQPLQNHTKNPESNLYVYSFSMNPEGGQPMGEANLTYLFNQQHEFWVNSSVVPRYIRIYALSYNIATVQSGHLTMLHSLYESGFKN